MIKDPEPNHRLNRLKGKQPRSFSETARGLLEWQRNDFSGRVFKNSDFEGKEEIRDTFIPEEGFEDNPEKLVRILDFLASRMRINDSGQLRRKLSELRNGGSVSILPTDKKLPPSEVLRNLLKGEYDKKIDESEIAERGQAYTLALYLYMHTSGDSEEEMVRILAHLIRNYNDPKANTYEHLSGVDTVGLEADPFLAGMCAQVIEKFGLHSSVRSDVSKLLGENPIPELARLNLKKVMRCVNCMARPSEVRSDSGDKESTNLLL